MDKIKELIQEAEELKGTFIKDVEMNGVVYITITSDREGMSTWITKCMRVVEDKEKQGKNSKLYKVFESHVDRIGSLKLDDFKELIGILKGIEETSEEDVDWEELNR